MSCLRVFHNLTLSAQALPQNPNIYHKDIKNIFSLYSSRFSLYTPSMLSSAAIATAAALGMTTNGGQESDFDINELVRRLQILTRVDYVSFVSSQSYRL